MPSIQELAVLSSLLLGISYKYYSLRKNKKKTQKEEKSLTKAEVLKIVKEQQTLQLEIRETLKGQQKNKRSQYFMKDLIKYVKETEENQLEIVQKSSQVKLQVLNSYNTNQAQFSLAVLSQFYDPEIQIVIKNPIYLKKLSKAMDLQKINEIIENQFSHTEYFLQALPPKLEALVKKHALTFYLQDVIEDQFQLCYEDLQQNIIIQSTEKPIEFRKYCGWLISIQEILTGKEKNLSKEQVIDILNLTKIDIKDQIQELYKAYQKERISYFKGDENKYRQCIFEYNQKVGHILNQSIQKLLQNQMISQELFDQALLSYSNHSDIITILNELQTGTYDEDLPEVEQNLTDNLFEDIFTFKNQQIRSYGNQIQVTTDFGMQYINAIIIDSIKEKFNIDETMYRAARKKYITQQYERFSIHIQDENSYLMQLLSKYD